MDKHEMLKRTRQLTVDSLKLIARLPRNLINIKISDQVTRSSVSVGANYRAACRAKSKADFINKLKIVEEEADETMFHYEVLMEVNTTLHEEMKSIHKRYDEVVAIVVSTIKTLRAKDVN